MKLLPEKSPSSAIIAASLIMIITSSCISSSKKHTGNMVIEWIKFSDPKTGHEVWQLTNNDSASESFYFYAQSFTSDDRYVIFRSKRSGTWDTYRCDLTSGEITRLTSDENIRTACIHPDGVSMAFISGWKYYKLNVYDLKQEMVMDFTGKLPSKPFFRPTFTKDGRYTLIYTREETSG